MCVCVVFILFFPKQAQDRPNIFKLFCVFFITFQNNFLVNFEPTSLSLSSSFFFRCWMSTNPPHHTFSQRRDQVSSGYARGPTLTYTLMKGGERKFWIFFFCYFSRFFSIREGKRKKQEGKRCWVVLCLLINAAGPCFAGRAVIPSCEVMAAALKDGPPSNWQSSYKPQMQD